MPLELSLVLCAFADLFVKTVPSLVSCFRESWTFSVQKYDILSFCLSFFFSTFSTFRDQYHYCDYCDAIRK